MSIPQTLAEQTAIVRKGNTTKRYHTVFTHQADTVGHHSANVAWLCHALSHGSPSVHLLTAALLHDTAETEVGDIPAPTKRAMDIRAKVAEYEATFLARYELVMPELTSEEEFILKLADCMDGYFFCLTEQKIGNHSNAIMDTAKNYKRYIHDLLKTKNDNPFYNQFFKQLEEAVNNV